MVGLGAFAQQREERVAASPSLRLRLPVLAPARATCLLLWLEKKMWEEIEVETTGFLLLLLHLLQHLFRHPVAHRLILVRVRIGCCTPVLAVPSELLEEIQKKEALDKYGAEGSGKNLPF